MGSSFPTSDRILSLWPGFPAPDLPNLSDGRYRPANYPLSPISAQSYINELRAMDARCLEDLRQAAVCSSPSASLVKELAAISGLAQTGTDGYRKKELETDEAILLTQAQKAILWIWLEEEKISELLALGKHYQKLNSKLRRSFSDNDSNDYGKPMVMDEISIQPDKSLIPSWRTVLPNACVFIESKTPIFAEGELKDILLDTFAFQKNPDWENFLYPEKGVEILCAKGNLERLLDGSPSILSQSHAGKKIITTERIWLVQGSKGSI